jgi:hypothetical protein
MAPSAIVASLINQALVVRIIKQLDFSVLDVVTRLLFA